MELLDKKVIVTGGASGFGLGIVKKFLNNGAKVVIADQNRTLADEQVQKLGRNAFSIETDVSNEESIENLKKQTKLTIGDPDILVNNAGITHLPDFIENISLEEFEKVLNVNVKSVFLITKAFVPKMKEDKSGVILNIASTAGISPRPKLTWYNATKGWMITATKSLAVELAPYNICLLYTSPSPRDS